MTVRRLIVVSIGVLLSACGTAVSAPETMCTNTAQSTAVTPSGATLSVGDTLRLAAAMPGVCPGATPTPVWRWKSANAAVASVDSLTGLVTAVGAGTTVVSAAPTFDPTVAGSATVKVLP